MYRVGSGGSDGNGVCSIVDFLPKGVDNVIRWILIQPGCIFPIGDVESVGRSQLGLAALVLTQRTLLPSIACPPFTTLRESESDGYISKHQHVDI